jgi:hypothetical protein
MATGQTVSLHDLLCCSALELGPRLELGSRLASAVIQLHGTEWWSEFWGSKDLLFFDRQDTQRRAADGTGSQHAFRSSKFWWLKCVLEA